MSNECKDKNELIKHLDREILLKLYENLSREVRELERNFVSLIVPIISALGVYGIGLKDYLQKSCSQNLIFFSATTLAFILLLIIVWFASNIFAYTHRLNQLILSRIEERVCLYKNGILPNNWNLNFTLSECNTTTDPPEIYKFFKLVSFLASIIGIGLYIFCVFIWNKKYDKIKSAHCLNLIVVIGAIILIILIILFAWKFRWCSWKDVLKCHCYSKKLKDIAINQKREP